MSFTPANFNPNPNPNPNPKPSPDPKPLTRILGAIAWLMGQASWVSTGIAVMVTAFFNYPQPQAVAMSIGTTLTLISIWIYFGWVAVLEDRASVLANDKKSVPLRKFLVEKIVEVRPV